MTPKERVIQIMRSSTTARIRFPFPTATGRVTIARQTFERVAAAIENRRVRVVPLQNPAPGVGAEYHSDTNEIHVPPIIGRTQEGLVVHECLHAAYDLKRVGITALDDEASCYVADALYFRMTGLRRPRWNAEPHQTAGAVADALLQEYQAGTRGIPAVSAQEWQVLRVVVMTHPVYLFPGSAQGNFNLGPVPTGANYLRNG